MAHADAPTHLHAHRIREAPQSHGRDAKCGQDSMDQQELVGPSTANSRIISRVAPVTLPPSPMGDVTDPDVTVQTVGYPAPELKVKDSAAFVISRKQASSPYLGSKPLHTIHAVCI